MVAHDFMMCERYFWDTDLISTPSSPPLSLFSIQPPNAQFCTLSSSSPLLSLSLSLSLSDTHTQKNTCAEPVNHADAASLRSAPLRSPISHPSWQSDRLHFNQESLRGGNRIHCHLLQHEIAFRLIFHKFLLALSGLAGSLLFPEGEMMLKWCCVAVSTRCRSS